MAGRCERGEIWLLRELMRMFVHLLDKDPMISVSQRF
jgi:hypothetical protein